MGALGGGTVSYERGSPVVPCHVRPISFGNHAQRAIRSEAYLGGAHLGADSQRALPIDSQVECLPLSHSEFTNFVGPGFFPLHADGFVPHTQPFDLRRVGSSVCGRAGYGERLDAKCISHHLRVTADPPDCFLQRQCVVQCVVLCHVE